jgi:hypothetical protein
MVDSIRQHEGREKQAEADERQGSWKESDEKRFGPVRRIPHDPEPAPIPDPKKSYDRAFRTGWSVVKAGECRFGGVNCLGKATTQNQHGTPMCSPCLARSQTMSDPSRPPLQESAPNYPYQYERGA